MKQTEAGHSWKKQSRTPRSKIIEANVYAKKQIKLDDIQKNIQSWITKQPANIQISRKTESPQSQREELLTKKDPKKFKPIIRWDKEKPRENEPYQFGEYDKPYAKAPNEVNFIDGIGDKKGHPRSKIYIERPTSVQNIYNMRTRNYPLFTFSENPNEVNCCVSKIYKPQLHFFQEPEKQTYEYFDYNNPLQLDFQGYDYKKTFQSDEQAEEDAKEYKQQKNFLHKISDERKLQEVIKFEKRQEKFGMPKYFDVGAVPGHLEELDKIPKTECHWTEKFSCANNEGDPKFVRPGIASVPYKPSPRVQSHLFRTTDKEENKQIRAEKYELRRERVLARFAKQTEKEERQAEEEKEKEKLRKENEAKNLAVEDFVSYFTDKHDVVMKEFLQLPPPYKEKKYPSTLRETRYYKRLMNRQKRLAQQRATIKEQYLQECCESRQYFTFPEKNVEVDSVSIDADTISEQTSDDEDGLSVGKKGSKFELRGFFTKLVREPRGRLDVKPKSIAERPVRTCITREEWFDLMAPKSKPPVFFINCPSTVKRSHEPNAKEYSIVEQQKAVFVNYDVSPIKEMIVRTEELKKAKQLRPKVIKPPSIKVKKFNLTGYLYGKVKKDRSSFKKRQITSKGLNKIGIPLEVIERSNEIFDEKQRKKAEKDAQRLLVLGINMDLEPISRQDTHTEKAESSSDDDWVPELTNNKLGLSDRNWGIQKSIRFCEHLTSGIKAPEFREPVVGKCLCNVTTTNQENNYNLNISLPEVLNVPEDKVVEPNLNLEKKKYNILFDTRHHHKHFDNTQHKQIMVKYDFRIPRLGEKKSNAADGKITIDDDHLIDGDDGKLFPLPVVQEFLKKVKESHQSPFITRFVNFLHDRIIAGQKSMGFDMGFDDDFKNATIEELKADLESIMSCNSSNTSSDVTNFTQDSGSYFDIQNVKVPLRYMTKSQVPFYEINRTRVKANDFTKLNEYLNPYYFTPFGGQKQIMRKITKPKDQFYTNLVRGRSDIRARLNVDLPSFNNEKIGVKGRKYISKLMTEWDDYYQHEIKNRPRICNIKCREILAQSRAALRRKFIALYSKEQITQMKIAQKILNRYFAEFYEFRDLCEKLFSSWKEEYYRRSMKTLQELEPQFAITRKLQLELNDLREQFRLLNMKIVYMENDWITCIGYQNFHYLLAELTWRHDHDWIHYDPVKKGMENARLSIKNRFIVNIRNRDRDDAFEIKNYYENVYLKVSRPPLYPFKTPDEFREGLENNKIRVYISLVHMHVKIWNLAELTKQYEDFIKKSETFLDNREKYVNHRSKRKNFLQKQSQNLEENGRIMFDTELKVSIVNHTMRVVTALCECMYEYFIPLAVRNELKLNFSIIDKFGMVQDLVINALYDIDKFPVAMISDIEPKVRTKKNRTMKMSENACALENRINFVMQSVMRNLQPPYKKPKREGKLPRSYLVKRKKKVIIPVVTVDSKIKMFYKAFDDDQTIGDQTIRDLTEEELMVFKEVWPDKSTKT